MDGLFFKITLYSKLTKNLVKFLYDIICYSRVKCMELLSGSLKRDMWMWASTGNKCTLDAYETTNTISPYGKNTTLTFKTRVKMMPVFEFLRNE